MRAAALTVSVALSVALASCAASEPTAALSVTIAGVTVLAERADTPAQQRQGLAGRADVPTGTGMWFPIAPARETEVWMRDTLVPLDVVWIRDGHVAGVVTLQPCQADPCSREASPGAVDAILEAPAGTFAGVPKNTKLKAEGTTHE